MASMPLLFTSSSPSSSHSCCCSNSTSRIALRLAHNHDFRRSKLPKAVAVAVSPLSPRTVATLPQNRALSYKYPTGVFTSGRTNSTGKLNHVNFRVSCVTERAADSDIQVDSSPSPPPSSAVDCVGTGLDVECLATDELSTTSNSIVEEVKLSSPFKMSIFGVELWELALLISPFFFWGTAMVAMKGVLPKTGPFFVSAFRLIPAGVSLVGFAASRGRPLPSGLTAWLSVSLFALVDATCFQVPFISLSFGVSLRLGVKMSGLESSFNFSITRLN